MSVESQVPDAGTPIFDRNGFINPVWHQFFFTLLRRTGGTVGVDSGSETARITKVEKRIETAEQAIQEEVQVFPSLDQVFPEFIFPQRPRSIDEFQQVATHGLQYDPDLHDVVSPSKNGFMSSADKTKLDGVAENATAVTILGTVSQTGGVPTGSVIERGSNANGEYVKFADGTMIQKLVISSQSIAVTGAYAGVFYGPAALLSWTYPVAFVGTMPAARLDAYASPHLALGALAGAPSLTAATFVVKDEQTYTANFNLTYTAFGRWF
ncbi:hypothetical protein [Pseudomonas sp. MONT-RG-20F-20-E-7-02]|uniref:hypothetical protein n=1 Tax=Pseudomonas sp. MONT-RG-20F-20-E-7-02 TaxID=2914979 RepID=UPI001F572496|nr:hypothetical protein [Pseudomonas sp. MONT-RG-20F-20-E-7-02]